MCFIRSLCSDCANALPTCFPPLSPKRPRPTYLSLSPAALAPAWRLRQPVSYKARVPDVGLSAPAVQFQVAGACGATSFTNTSDMRKKDVIENKTLELWQVAQAPIFSFTWKGGEYDRDVHVGTSAQYWQSHLPEVITKDSEGYLSMPYDVVALLAAITTAKKVQDHEQRIQALERENAALKNELNRLKAA